MPHLRALVQASILALIGINPALAHEFWIDPVDPTIAPGETIAADLRVGENMKGSGLIFNPNSFTQFGVVSPDGNFRVDGRMGDRPALNFKTGSDGLYIAAHMTTASKLIYREFEKFATFARTHGQAFAIDAHMARGLPEEGFTEAYFRCAKALVKVGSGAGQDRDVGFPFELTALNNPYTDAGPVRLKLTYKGAIKPDHQVDVFFKAEGASETRMISYQTDASGEVSIPREIGDFLVNAVVLEEPTPDVAELLGAVWVSLWASTTYTIEG